MINGRPTFGETTMRTTKSLFALLAMALLSAPAMAQSGGGDTNTNGTAASDTVEKAKSLKSVLSTQKKIEVQNYRPVDQRGINMFEAPKHDGVPYKGFALMWGASFTQQYQGLDHSNTATPNVVNSVNQNQLMDIGGGFNNANANLYLDAQLAKGIRVALTSYLSSRHHNETWVKDGYLLIDASPIDVEALNNLMEFVTIKAGHFEVNYGDAHFRRTDNGNAMYNPFVGNLILDAFTTEIGGEVYLRAGPLMAMGSVTGGEVRGNVVRPADRSLAFIGKLGWDSQVNDKLRVRLTGSTFQQRSAISNTLYAGDRAGSRYYYVMENTTATESAQFRSGMINPNFADKVKSYMINPFVKFGGIEFFGVIEKAKGRAANETALRTVDQYSAEAVYRFLADDKLFVGGRWNEVSGRLQGIASDVSTDRVQLSGGWFLTPGIMLKAEWVKQKYNDFPAADIRNGGKFDGFVVEGVVGF
jgi:hypothetical protein